MRIRGFVFPLVFLVFALLPSPVKAEGVVSICDEAHLLAALAGGGTVTFTCSGTITLSSTITVADDTAIDGSGQAVIISGNNAVRVITVNSGAQLYLDHVTITEGWFPLRAAGGIANYGMLTVRNSHFFRNRGDYAGGGIANYGMLHVSDSTFTENTANGTGAGIHNAQGTAIVSNSTFSNNRALWGGGIVNESALTVSNSAFFGNSAYAWGGGISNRDNMIVRESSFVQNSARFGGGIHTVDNNGARVSSSSFIDNHAEKGGAISIGHDYQRGTLTASNSTFFANGAGGGGGIYNAYQSRLIMSNNTFSHNRATLGGGLYSFSESTILAINTIVAHSQEGGNCYGTIIDGGGNLSFPDTTCPGINADPMLGRLQINGGPTETMDLGQGSAAIDAGVDAVCMAAPVNGLDQRGITRPVGAHCDIGAVERLPFRTLLPTMLAE